MQPIIKSNGCTGMAGDGVVFIFSGNGIFSFFDRTAQKDTFKNRANDFNHFYIDFCWIYV